MTISPERILAQLPSGSVKISGSPRDTPRATLFPPEPTVIRETLLCHWMKSLPK
jgi:hypothetical protein